MSTSASEHEETFHEFREGPTPAGGVRSEIYYLDERWRPTRKDKATRAEALEYDAEGRVLQRIYLTLKGSGDSA